MLVHNVYFYFKESATPDQVARCMEAAAGLRRIETVRHLWVGTPAKVPDRPALEKGWAFALTVVFDSVSDHNSYQEHALHLEFVSGFKDLWEKVVVYDAD